MLGRQETSCSDAPNDSGGFNNMHAKVQAMGFHRQGNNPYSNTYNPGCRNHPNFSWSNNNKIWTHNLEIKVGTHKVETNKVDTVKETHGGYLQGGNQ